MAESGNRSPVRISQKRLSIVLAVLGLLGCIVLGIAWWDSAENVTIYSSKMGSFSCFRCAILFKSEPFVGTDSFVRTPLNIWHIELSLFPTPEIKHDSIYIPIYLLILTYLATLLLIWIVLMNRLARRDFTKAISIPK